MSRKEEYIKLLKSDVPPVKIGNKNKYIILDVSFGIVRFIDDDLKIRKMKIEAFKKYCCEKERMRK